MNFSWITLSLQKKKEWKLETRRTIRKYQQKDISADLLNDLLETSFRASTVGNMQVYSVIVTRDAERKKQTGACTFQSADGSDGAGSATFCIDFVPFQQVV